MDRKKIRGRFQGEKCVVIGNGPSLTVELLEAIREKSVFTFVANGFCFVFDRIDFTPGAVCMSNFEAIGMWLEAYPPVTLKFFKAGWREAFKPERGIENVYDLPFACVHDQGRHVATFIGDGHFSMDPFLENFCGDTVLLDFAVPMAVYMGFEDIYLCGVDCDYTRGYFDNKYPVATDTEFRGMINEDFSIAIPSYKYAKRVLNSLGKGFYKLTESKRLDFIPTRTLEDLEQGDRRL